MNSMEIIYPQYFINIIKNEVEKLLKKKNTVIIGIDGRCASGKSTFAKELCNILGANLFHTDDFYLPNNMRTKERLSMPGGNVHYERFLEEIILPIKGKKSISYRAFSCNSQDYLEEKIIFPNEVNVVEGAYSMTKDLYESYDFTIFMTSSKDIQMKRLIQRNQEEGAKRFKDIWIPLEEKYISFYNLSSKCDLVIDTTDFF